MKSSTESSDGYILSFTVRSQERRLVEGWGRRGTNMTPGWPRWVGGMKGEGGYVVQTKKKIPNLKTT